MRLAQCWPPYLSAVLRNHDPRLPFAVSNLTLLATPLTEIVARVTFAAGAFEPPVNRLEDGVLPELRFGLEAGFGAPDGVSEAQVEAPVAVVTPPQSEICW